MPNKMSVWMFDGAKNNIDLHDEVSRWIFVDQKTDCIYALGALAWWSTLLCAARAP